MLFEYMVVRIVVSAVWGREMWKNVHGLYRYIDGHVRMYVVNCGG
jgi:hypothetical protein